MRRLTLILSDLYLPADAVRESFPTSLDLPALESLLRFAPAPRRIAEWRSWLAKESGVEAVDGWPAAHVHALALGMEPAGAWLATPVRLEARLDHVRLSNRGILNLPVEQLARLAAEFRETFGAEQLVAAGATPTLMLVKGPAGEARTVDPARLLDADVGAALPQGPAARDLRRLSAEIEMWLPATRVNAERTRAGQAAIIALWFWGGGAPMPRKGGGHGDGEDRQLWGAHSFLASLRVLMGQHAMPFSPADFGELRESREAVVVVSPMSGPSNESLVEMESRWFAPIRNALSAGKLESFRLVANDRVFDVAARARWKFWRRKRSWLESLA